MIYSSNNDSHGKIICHLQWVYAHGDLETFLGFDNISTDEQNIAVKYSLLTMRPLNGISDHYTFETEAMNDKGETVPVKLYMWRAGDIPRGLAVSAHNVTDVSYALDMYFKRSEML